MRRETLLLIVGLLIFVTPLLGVPQSWVDIYLYVLGAFIILIAISCRLRIRRQGRSRHTETLHVENDPRQPFSADEL